MLNLTALMMLATTASETPANNESGPQPNSSEEVVNMFMYIAEWKCCTFDKFFDVAKFTT